MKYFSLLIFLFFTSLTFSQPDWKVNYPAYQYNMTMTGIIVLDYVNSTDTNDIVGAFVNDECRGVVSPVLNTSNGKYYVDLVVYGNESSDSISFKVYCSKNNSTIKISKTIDFEINKITGSRTHPYYWSSPTLSNQAKFLKFNIDGQIGETIISDSTITMKFAADFLLEDAVATFEVSQRTSVIVDTTVQVSGSTRNNFTDTILYKVTSADETSVTNYKVISISENKLEPDITNTITPNGDGINDYWIIKNKEVFEGYELSIFTSRGLKVFSTKSYKNTWNGKYNGNTLPAGVYYYILKKDNKVFSGTISLIR